MHTASLDIRDFASNEPGWVEVNASNGQSYSYRYSGGTDNKGGMILKIGKGSDTLNVQLNDHRYEMVDCSFRGKGVDQLSWRGSKHAGAIVDKNDDEADVKYTIQVKDTENGNCTFDCDPVIKNVPPGGF